jgi:hypothetical protein
MDELVKSVFTAPLATLFIIAGILFLLIAVIGNISGKIEPGEKARMVSGVIGLAFIVLGLTMHVFQKPPGAPELPVVSPLQTKPSQTGTASQEPTTGSQIPKQEVIPGGLPIQKKEVLSSQIQTRFPGAGANIIRFEKSGEFVILQLMIQNTSSRLVPMACFYESQTNLIDEATGESWQPKESVGQSCTALEVKKSSRMWMKFAIPSPEKRTFSLSSPLFQGTLDNLVLADPS